MQHTASAAIDPRVIETIRAWPGVARVDTLRSTDRQFSHWLGEPGGDREPYHWQRALICLAGGDRESGVGVDAVGRGADF